MYQFIHLETYSLSGGKSRTTGQKKWSVSEIFAEAMRKPEDCEHVENPQPPNRLRGLDLKMVEKILEVEAAKAVDTSGKKLKKTAHVLIAGVVSYPLETKYLKNNDEKLKLYEEWQKRTIKHIDQEFGADNVMCILEHTDEEYPHLHFYVKPKLTPDKTYTLDDLHPGRRAVKEMGGYTKENGKQRRIAYKAGMREFQDRFYNSVSSYFAHARTGPRRQRLTREGWKAQTEINKQNALLKIENEALQRQIEQLKNPPPPPSRLNFSAEKMEEFRLEKSTQILRRQFKI